MGATLAADSLHGVATIAGRQRERRDQADAAAVTAELRGEELWAEDFQHGRLRHYYRAESLRIRND